VSGRDDDIVRFLAHLAAPPREQIDELLHQGRAALLAKGEPLCRAGDAEHRIAFLHTGIVRYHVVVPQTGQDVTKDFGFAGSFATSFGSAVRGEPARVAVTAVEDCAVTIWPFATLRAMLERDAEWEKLGRRIAEALYVRKEQREVALLVQSAEERYRAMREAWPEEVERIPKHMLASYLGVAPETLSRLRRRVG
jgi:CRP-like cAMP-binding protein